jgi:hypothetical protein
VEAKTGSKLFTHQEIEDALISNALLLFFAGFDTASTGIYFRFNLSVSAKPEQAGLVACTIKVYDRNLRA